MEYMVWIIYVAFLAQLFIKHRSSDGSLDLFKIKQSYKNNAITNMLIGGLGSILWSQLLQDSALVPKWCYWVGLVGLTIIHLSAYIFLYFYQFERKAPAFRHGECQVTFETD